MSEKFNDVAPCAAHSAFTTLGFKMPPERDDPDNIVMSFSDCTISEGTSFSDDLAPALSAWGEHLTNAGSTAGIWVLFPAYGGGGEEFDFKYVSAFGSLEELGASWDSYNADGWEKASELFAGKVSCDSSRVYAAKNRRRLADD